MIRKKHWHIIIGYNVTITMLHFHLADAFVQSDVRDNTTGVYSCKRFSENSDFVNL